MKNKKIIVIFLIVIIILIVINYIILKNYSFSLKGNSEIYLNVNDKWDDPGYILSNKNKKVSIENNLNTEIEGTYYVYYTFRVGLFKKNLKRTIYVLNQNYQTDFIFNLIDNNPYYLMINTDYKEPGFQAFDSIDGNLNNQVTVSNNIQNNENGTYEVKYKVKNSQGIIKERTRKIIVYSLDFNSWILNSNYSKENEIILNINDINYDYTVLPDKEITYNRTINYYINKNGLYQFNLYDKSHNYFTYEVNITNIDNESPTGTCILSLYDKKGEIKVNAKDNDKIKGYIYNYGNNKTDLLETNKYEFNTLDEVVSVSIYDEAGNNSNISCSIEDKSTKYSRSYTLENLRIENRDNLYWFYKPNDNTVRKKLPLLVYFHGDGGRSNPKNINKYAYPNFIYEGMDFPFYMIAPYCNNETDFSSDNKMLSIKKIIDYVTENYNIDTDRIILSGGSSGARGAYTMASVYRDTFSCLVIGSGITYGLSSVYKNLNYLPIWIFHGINDSAIPISDVENGVNLIKGIGGNVKFSSINGGHEITEEVFKYPELIEWMITQRKSNNKKG